MAQETICTEPFASRRSFTARMVLILRSQGRSMRRRKLERPYRAPTPNCRCRRGHGPARVHRAQTAGKLARSALSLIAQMCTRGRSCTDTMSQNALYEVWICGVVMSSGWEHLRSGRHPGHCCEKALRGVMILGQRVAVVAERRRRFFEN